MFLEFFVALSHKFRNLYELLEFGIPRCFADLSNPTSYQSNSTHNLLHQRVQMPLIHAKCLLNYWSCLPRARSFPVELELLGVSWTSATAQFLRSFALVTLRPVSFTIVALRPDCFPSGSCYRGRIALAAAHSAILA